MQVPEENLIGNYFFLFYNHLCYEILIRSKSLRLEHFVNERNKTGHLHFFFVCFFLLKIIIHDNKTGAFFRIE